MTRLLPFAKMTGAGNDFALIARPRGAFAGPTLARRLCDRRRSIGADGLLVVDESRSRPRVSYFNADGSQAFCGNGTRCAAWWLGQKRGFKPGRVFSLDTAAGPVRAEITGPGRAAILMPEPSPVKLGMSVHAAGRSHVVHFINTGAPHAVVETRNPRSAPVGNLGPLLRRHKAFGRGGANVDFAGFAGNRVMLRTFEKGVETETLACGTGAVAAALVGRALGRLRGDSIKVLTSGGDALNVMLKPTRRGRIETWLEGPATLVFSGEIRL